MHFWFFFLEAATEKVATELFFELVVSIELYISTAGSTFLINMIEIVKERGNMPLTMWECDNAPL